MATVITSIGTRAAENVDIQSVSGTGPWTVTLASVPSGTKVGDTLNDEAATPNSYLITAISGNDLTVRDAFGAGVAPDASGTSQATTERTYAGATTALGSWEADLDDTGIYASGDDAEGQVYNDGGTSYDQSITINGGGTVGLNSITLTVPSSDRHDGTAGTGSRIVASTPVSIQVATDRDVYVDWLEIDENGKAADYSISFQTNSATAIHYARWVIVHGVLSSSSGHKQTIRTTIPQSRALNCCVYDITGGNVGNVYGILLNQSREMNVYNSTVYKIEYTGSDVNYAAYGIAMSDRTDNRAKNNISVDSASQGGTPLDYSFPGINIDSTNNLSSDASADDAGGTGHLINKLSSNQFVSTSPVDLHLKSGADAIDAGVDLGTTPTGVNIDIDGRDRDANNDTWDMGADEFVSAGGLTITPDPAVVTMAAPSPTLVKIRTLTPSPAQMPLSAQSPSLLKQYTLTPSPAAVAMVSPSIAMQKTHTLTPDPAAVGLAAPSAGTQKTLSLTPSPASIGLLAPSVSMQKTLSLTPSPVAVGIVAPSVSINTGFKHWWALEPNKILT